MTLTLSRAVTSAETVSVSYTKPESGNVVRDAAGNGASDFSGQAVTNNTPATPAPADTTPPVINAAVVTGDKLVLTYTEANTLDAAALAGNAGFTVNTAAGAAAITVSSAVVNATAKTVTLTLSRAVAATETVTVSYTKPESGAVVQDAAGNDAANFSSQPVTHSTSTPPGTQGPTLAATNPITISDDKLSLGERVTVTIRFSEAIAESSFSIADLTVGGGARLFNLQSTDGGTTWTVTLMAPTVLDVASSSTGNKISVNLAGITNRAGTAGVGTADSTVTYDVDVNPPSVHSATVTGDQLVLTYTEAGTLDAATLTGNAGFTVNTAAGTQAITVNSAAVNGPAKTITLTLSRAVGATETVTVSYAKPENGNVVRDAAGNHASNFSEKAVTHDGTTAADTTPPVINTAVVNGNQLVLTYTEANTLDAAALAGNAGFTVNTAAGATAITVSGAVVNATDKTITLTLSRTVAATETVTVSYTKPESGAVVQDAAGNDAANFSSQPVTHSTSTPPGTQGPTLAATNPITISDDKLSLGERVTVTIRFSEAIAESSFSIADLTVGGGARLFNLQSTDGGTTWTVTLMAPTVLDVASSSTGNKISVNLAGITNRAGTAGVGTADSTVTYDVDVNPPRVHSATVNGNQLVLTYTEANTLDAAALAGNAGFTVNTAAGTQAITVNSAAVNGPAKTITLTLSRAVGATETVTVSYAKPENGNVVRDAAGNHASNFSEKAVTHDGTTAADTTPPVINTAVVNGDRLVITYTEAGTLDGAALAGNAGFTVNTAAGATAITVSSAVVNATAKTVTLTLSRAVASTETVTVSYTKPESGAVVQDAAGNDAANFSSQPVTHSTSTPPGTQGPTLAATNPITISDDKLHLGESVTVTIRFSEAIATDSFTTADLTVGGGATLSNLQSTDGGTTWTVTLTAPGFLDILLAPTADRNSTGNKISVNLAGITNRAGTAGAGTAESTVTYDIDVTPPSVSSAAVNGDQLVLSFIDANILGDTALTGSAGFTVGSTTGTAITVNSAVINATVKTVTLTLSRAVTSSETVSVSYTKPESGNVVRDAAGNGASDFSGQAVTNNTPATPAPADTTPPVINTAVVTGDKLVLTYTEANTLDAAALAGNAGFTVNTAAGATAITVSGAVVNATAKTVTLTLSRAVAATETVTVSYTKPESGAVVQDAAGNDAVSFSNQAVTHGTPSDTTAPVINTAVVTGDKLVLSYTEEGSLDAVNTAAASAFVVSSAGNAAAISVNSVAVSGQDRGRWDAEAAPWPLARPLTWSLTKPRRDNRGGRTLRQRRSELQQPALTAWPRRQAEHQTPPVLLMHPPATRVPKGHRQPTDAGPTPRRRAT
ncbi:hypothetical protein D5039_20490 [Verminephrobacter aporrectodeae subsp. tuberculatae]|uniref:Bacterial Ig-like domain-containing protein n=1 Tax=Verminephrobacter aporrectodeae subsp. tuberculatae TaxID=1110392 RepID=A0ABT3KYL0_9BURK|nr:hypothetical protein [Verminephrobacter aporrectodeae subsp. tuberculatae]